MRRTTGFTLVELMVTVAIVAVIVAMAIPSYNRYTIRSQRSSAQQLMMEIASKEQQYILDARTYTATIGTGGLNVASRDTWNCVVTCTNAFYTISVTADNDAAPPYYIVRAAPQGSQADDGTLTVDSTGTKARLVDSVDQGW